MGVNFNVQVFRQHTVAYIRCPDYLVSVR